MQRRSILAPGSLTKRQVPLHLAAIREPECGRCKLHRGCNTPKMMVKGKGQKGYMVVGEAPGKTEDELGKPFVGKTGQHLQNTLGRLGLDLFRDCWVTNALSCRPPGNKIPSDDMVEWCRPKVLKAIHTHKPHTVILLGGKAAESVVGWLWGENAGITAWAGWNIPSRRINAWLCPTFHPSFVLREDKGRGPNVAQVVWESHLEQALAHRSPPYLGTPPDLESSVVREINPDVAAELIQQMASTSSSLAFDYETNMAKPDHHNAHVVSCAFSDGAQAVAFPWLGAAAREARRVFESDLPKIAHNSKFEQRWTQDNLGCSLNNLVLDTMIAAHVINNQRSTKSLKFQAFVRLGIDRYDDHLHDYLKAPNGNTHNRIRELDLDKLLLYNGMDALVTHQLAEVMAPEVGVIL